MEQKLKASTTELVATLLKRTKTIVNRKEYHDFMAYLDFLIEKNSEKTKR